MYAVKVSVNKVIDYGQPYWVECELTDAYGVKHLIHEKLPVVTQYYNDDVDLPIDGLVYCEIVKWENDRVTINTENPIGIESVNGETVFTVLESQIVEVNQ